jgi:hypothetical protein
LPPEQSAEVVQPLPLVVLLLVVAPPLPAVLLVVAPPLPALAWLLAPPLPVLVPLDPPVLANSKSPTSLAQAGRAATAEAASAK